ncbi:MAG: ABC transporter substrate-binding protein [Planctomycetes bacterium]|nr:ABC transporter substrate-binding protein [Planctomycetota bacterium]
MGADPIRARAVLASAAIALVAAAAAAQGRALTDAELRGRKLYLEGEAASGRKIVALLGEAKIEVPARSLPCAGCHAFDGRGKPEGGVVPSDIRWEALTKPYGARHTSGREHGPYDERALRRAITQGRDPAGNALSNVMPQYQLTQDEVEDLAAFLKRIGSLRDPGLGDERVRIAAVVPHGARGDARAAVLRGLVDDLAAEGGVHGRKVELVLLRDEARAPDADPGATPGANSVATAGAASLGALRAALAADDVFAFVASDLDPGDATALTAIDATGTPVIGALSEAPGADAATSRYVFELHAGLRVQAAALAAHLLATAPGARVGIVDGGDERSASLARELDARWTGAGRASPSRASLAPGADAAELARALARDGVEAVLLLAAPAEQAGFLRSATELAFAPRVLVPGPLAARGLRQLAGGFPGTIEVSLPRAPDAPDAPGAKTFVEFAAKHGLALDAHVPDQVDAWCAAHVLVEGLRRAGRELGREKLVQALEGLYKFDAGLGPPLTFGPGRRVGARGAHVLRLDRATGAPAETSAWIPVDG